ncbi:hypothetical protein N9891_01440 [bacterium]|nr:hypothetical protein [bacterium]
MKTHLVLWILSMVSSLAAEMEIRSYQIGPSTLRSAYWNSVRDIEINYEDKDWLGPITEKVPFQSRFLKDSKTIRNVTARLSKMIGVKQLEGTAVYSEGENRLVVETNARWHNSLKLHLKNHIVWNLRTEISIFETKESLRKRHRLLHLAPPKNAKLLTSLTCLHLPGQTYTAQTPKGDLAVEMEGQIDGDYDDADLRTTLSINHPKAIARWKTGLNQPIGVYTLHDIGSMDGETGILATIKTDLVSTSGTAIDNWIQKEKSGPFLLKQRLAGLQNNNPWVHKRKENAQGYYEILVPPTFASFIMTSPSDEESDPFASIEQGSKQAPYFKSLPAELRHFRNSGLLDLKKLLQENGVTFRPGDFVALDESMSRIYVKVSDEQLELLDGILMPAGLGPPRSIGIELTQIKLPKSGKHVEGKILRKLGLQVLPGQIGTLKLGKLLKAEFESQIDGNDELIDVRMSLAQNGDLEEANLKSGFTVQNDVPIVVQETQTPGNRTVWVLTARVLAMDHEIRELVERAFESE